MTTSDQDTPGTSRRRFLLETAALAGTLGTGTLGTGTLGTGLLLSVRPASATPESMRAAIRKVVGEAPVKKGKVKVDLPPLIENGNAVALTVSVDSPMTADNYVEAIHVFTEKNPQPNVMDIHLGPRAGRASVSARIRLADSQKVAAIARMSDGSFWSDEIEVVVTLAACLEVF
jgi:sulfur-oxidizing protein SoxY